MSQAERYATPEMTAARALYPEIGERVLEIEAARRLPADLARKLTGTGLFHMGIPAVYGGGGRSLAEMLRAIEDISSVDGSVGWCAMIYCTMGLVAGLMPAEQAREVYGKDRMAISCGATAPSGRGEWVSGGMKVSGRWAWGSGAHNCEWIGGGTFVMQDGKPPLLATGEPKVHVVFFERKQVTLIDNWDPSGLIGSGSGDFEVKDVFVPQDRWIVLGDLHPAVDGALYRLPFFGALAMAHAAMSMGVAKCAIESFTGLARSKVPAWQKDPLAKSAIVQTALGRAEAQLNAIRANIYEIAEEVTDVVARGDAASLEHRRRMRLAAVYAVETAAAIVDVMYNLGGGSSVHRSSPLQRCLRDIHVGTQHGMISTLHYKTAATLKLFGERPIALF